MAAALHTNSFVKGVAAALSQAVSLPFLSILNPRTFADTVLAKAESTRMYLGM